MDSMRNAAKNTSFQSWLDATVSRTASGASGTAAAAVPQCEACGTSGTDVAPSGAVPNSRLNAAGATAPTEGSLEEQALTDVAPYLQPPTSQPDSTGWRAHGPCACARSYPSRLPHYLPFQLLDPRASLHIFKKGLQEEITR